MVSNERAFIIGTISFLLLLAVSSQVRHLGDMKHEEEVVLRYQLKKNRVGTLPTFRPDALVFFRAKVRG